MSPSQPKLQPFAVRAPRPEDTEAMARVHIETWQETYRGLVPDEELDDPENYTRRREIWESIIANAAGSGARVAIAVNTAAGSQIAADGVIGIALAMPHQPADSVNSAEGTSPAPDGWELKVLYVYRTFYGTGAGAALLNAVTSAEEDTYLWVADPNPRAQAFYAKHGFAPTGKASEEFGLAEIEMCRSGERQRRGTQPQRNDSSNSLDNCFHQQRRLLSARSQTPVPPRV